MEAYRIITDSSCDLTQEMADALGLTIAPLMLNFDGVEYPNDLDYRAIDIKKVYAGLRSGIPTSTTAANPAAWVAATEPVLEQGLDALLMAFSSGLSTTYHAACLAADELREKYPKRKIYVVDTLSASLGQGLLIWHTAKLRESGATLEQARDFAEENKLHLCHWFTVDDLHFLRRGGRISAATAVAGTMLQIKPVMHMDDEGHLTSVSKARGRRASIQAMAAKIGESAYDPAQQTMFICHGDCLEDAEYLKALIMEKYHVPEVCINYTGPVIGSHSGPGTLALFFLGKQR